MRKLTKRQARIVGELIADWRKAGVVSTEEATRLSGSIEVSTFDWKRLAAVSLVVSVLCLMTAIAAILDDKFLVELLDRLFDSPDWAKCIGFAVLATACYGIGFRRRQNRPRNVFTNEAILFFGVLATAAAIFFLGAAASPDGERFSLLLLLACGVYGALGAWTGSKLIWVFALLSLGSWFGAETGYLSGWGVYYLGMSYPMRFVAFGLVLCAASYGVGRIGRIGDLSQTTLTMGLLYLFVALWLLSIFGDHTDAKTWVRAGPFELFHWSVLFAAAAGLAIWHGLRFDNGVSRGFGITFLFINLFTRFFEFFWEPLHKSVFFAILGVALWFLGGRAQKIWNLGRRNPPAESA
jgi:hypothetical protein